MEPGQSRTSHRRWNGKPAERWLRGTKGGYPHHGSPSPGHRIERTRLADSACRAESRRRHRHQGLLPGNASNCSREVDRTASLRRPRGPFASKLLPDPSSRHFHGSSPFFGATSGRSDSCRLIVQFSDEPSPPPGCQLSNAVTLTPGTGWASVRLTTLPPTVERPASSGSSPAAAAIDLALRFVGRRWCPSLLASRGAEVSGYWRRVPARRQYPQQPRWIAASHPVWRLPEERSVQPRRQRRRQPRQVEKSMH